MSKWKCEICNSEFDNFQAQGFNHKIYCPLCYYKELYRQTELERERLNNIIDELEKEINNQLNMTRKFDEYNEGYFNATLNYYNKLKALKEGKEWKRK